MAPRMKVAAFKPKKATSSEATAELGKHQAPNRTAAMEHGNEKTWSVNGGEASTSARKTEDCHEESSDLFIKTEDNIEIGATTPQPLQMILGFDNENGTPKNSGSKNAKRSGVWENFTLENSPDGSTGARCKQCKTVLSGNINSGTSHLLRHAKFHCKGIPNEVAKSRKHVAFASQLTNTCDCEGSELSQDAIRRLFTQLLICTGLPFDVVEHPTFINFVKGLRPSFEFFNQETVRSDCIILYKEQRKKVNDILQKLDSRMNISYALWSSDKNVIYMAVTAHYIDDNFSVKKKLLNFKHISCLNTPQIFNEEIVRCIAEWDLNEKVSAVTFDSSSVNSFWTERVGEPFNEEMYTIENYPNVRSYENVLSVMALDGINILNREIGRIRKIIVYVTANASNLQKFNQIAQHFGLATRIELVVDVSRKWDATADMLQSALPYKKAINRFNQVYCNGVHPLSEQDWEKLEILTNILKAFVNANNAISNTKSTANLYFKEVWAIRSLLYEEYAVCDDTMRTLTLNMQQKCKIYWNECSSILVVAAILDPRYKFLFIQFCYENAFDKCNAKQNLDRIHEYLHKLYHNYEQAESIPDHSDAQDSRNTSQCIGKRKIETEFAKFLAKKTRRKLSKNDLDIYLDADVLVTAEDEEFDVLNWWKTNALRYPILSKMARDILAIPISTVASKLAFSSNKRLIDQHSIHLDTSTVESLICTQDWLNADYYSGEELFEDCMA